LSGGTIKMVGRDTPAHAARPRKELIPRVNALPLRLRHDVAIVTVVVNGT
jgi:hypothetical protein